MIEVILKCISFGFLAAFWAGVFLAARAAVRGIRSARYARACGFLCLVIAILYAGLHLGFTPGSSAYARYRYTRDMFGRSFVLGAPRLSYDSQRSFHGDGYSIEVYDISEALSRWSSSPPPDFTTSYPVRPSVRSDWIGVRWRQTPISAGDQKFMEFALATYADDKDFKEAKELLEKLAKEPGHYFAYFYKMNGEYVANLDFFLISPSKRVFISLNSNT